MRKWGPAVFLAVALGAFLVWAQCGEEPVVGYDSRTVVELMPIAERILGGQPRLRAWSGEQTIDATKSPNVEELIANVDSPRFDSLLRRDSLVELRQAIEMAPTPNPDPSRILDTVLLHLTYCRAALAKGDRATAETQLMAAATMSRDAVETAHTVEQWQHSQIARLRFLEVVPVLLRAWPKSGLAAMQPLVQVPDHRASLGRVLTLRYMDSGLNTIAEASERSRPSRAVSFALYGTEEGDEERLIASLLHRHPRAFSPELTVEAGAESVKSLRDSLGQSWANSRDVLDKVAATQKFWSDFQAMLDMSEGDATQKVTELGLAAHSLENPVGLAVLHSERLSWSGLVQSAYVADAKEAAFQYMLTGTATDPISSGELKVEDGKATFASNGNENYPFIKALTESPVSAALPR